jgi:hypothetical protein
MMDAMWEPETARALPAPLWQRLEELRTLLRRTDPNRLAARTGATLVAGSLRLPVWERPVAIDVCDFVAHDCATAAELDPFSQVLVAYYLYTADGCLPAGSWIAFSELPDGLFYAQAFQGYTGHRLAQVFGDDVDAFGRAALAAGGRAVTFGDRSFAFSVLPYVSLLAVCWLGDEELPTSYRLLFDSNASHHLTTDGCAVLGSALTRRLLNTAQRATLEINRGSNKERGACR